MLIIFYYQDNLPINFLYSWTNWNIFYLNFFFKVGQYSIVYMKHLSCYLCMIHTPIHVKPACKLNRSFDILIKFFFNFLVGDWRHRQTNKLWMGPILKRRPTSLGFKSTLLGLLSYCGNCLGSRKLTPSLRWSN